MKKDQEEKNLEKQVRDMYTPLSVAKKEIRRRWNDKELRKKADTFLNGYSPDFLKDGPKAFLGRHVASPDLELKHFFDLAKEINLEPVVIEDFEDKFIAENLDKYHLAKLYFFDGCGKNGGNKIDVLRIVDFKSSEGKKFSEIKTIWGENFIGFHHRILNLTFPNHTVKTFDISYWPNKKGINLEKFYSYYLALSIYGGIFFENFLINDEEREFTRNIVIPNFKNLVKIFGVKPLIIPVAPKDDECDLYWWCYPASVKKNINI